MCGVMCGVMSGEVGGVGGVGGAEVGVPPRSHAPSPGVDGGRGALGRVRQPAHRASHQPLLVEQRLLAEDQDQG